MIRFTMAVPWFLPGVVLSIAIALLACRPIGTRLKESPFVAWALLVGFGVVVSATLTPLQGDLDFEGVVIGTCDLSRISPAPIERLLRINDASLNVALVIPLGIAIGLVQGWRLRAVLIVASIVLPFAIETVQLVTPALDRGCQSSDVVDNLTGLFVGLVVGTGLRLVGTGIRDGTAKGG